MSTAGFGPDGGGGSSSSGGGSSSDKQKPGYCSSLMFEIGSFVDNDLGEGIQDLGTVGVGAGYSITAASWFTGVGAEAGADVAAGGGAVYAAGTAVSEMGNLAELFGGQSGLVTASKMLSLPTMGIKSPGAQIITQKILTYFVGKSVKDPCQ